MNVTEIFYSIQGEGRFIGHPAIFVRLHGCHIKCPWCDTKRSWKLPADKSTEMTTPQILDKIKKYKCQRVVITGGEPMLQRLGDLIHSLIMMDYLIEVETTGDIIPGHNIFVGKAVTYNISPKTRNTSFNFGNLMKGSYIFKFVYDGSRSSDKFIKQIIDKNDIPIENVYIMPFSDNRADYIKMADKTVNYCKKNNFNFSPREHLVIWDKKERV